MLSFMNVITNNDFFHPLNYNKFSWTLVFRLYKNWEDKIVILKQLQFQTFISLIYRDYSLVRWKHSGVRNVMLRWLYKLRQLNSSDCKLQTHLVMKEILSVVLLYNKYCFNISTPSFVDTFLKPWQSQSIRQRML